MKSGLKVLLVLVFSLIVLPGTLILSALIPRDALRENMLESGEYLLEGFQIYPLYPDLEQSTYDHYADSILLSIAWYYDAEHPVSSVASSMYYTSDSRPVYASLSQCVKEELPANEQYIRYWHGSLALIRPLMLLFNLKQLCILNAVILTALFLTLLLRLALRREFALTAAFAIAVPAVSSYFVPISLEYVWTYYVWLAACHVLLSMQLCGREDSVWTVFFLSGVLTAFGDFLTTEILPLLAPLLMLIYLQKKHTGMENRRLLRLAGKEAAIWCAGYAGMWVYKWLFASVVLRVNALDYVRGSVEERLGIGTGDFQNALRNNVRIFLTGNRQTPVSAITVLVVLLVLAAAIYVYHRKSPDIGFLGLMAGIGILPYVRYAVLQNHSAKHCFFTYRAQLVTVMALTLIFVELIEWRVQRHGTKKRKKA